METRHATAATPAIRATALAADAGDISRSWQRCRQAGLTPEFNRFELPHHGQGQLRAAADRRGALIAQARPVMEYMYSQIKDSGCVLLLSDEHGYLLESAGDTDFCHRAAQVALKPGACWAEDARGTNAVGTALVEAKPIVVNGPEHYLRLNSFLACAAAPLLEPSGKIIGVIDISCDARRYHPHTFGLVRAAAQMIENRIFELSFVSHMKLRLHANCSGLGGMMEGSLALSEDGRILGANRMGFDLLGLHEADIGQRQVTELFGVSMRELVEQDRHAQGKPVVLHRQGGGALFTALHQVKPIAVPGFTAPKPERRRDALDALDTGDARMQKAIAQLRRVLGRPVPILLQGETGAGKDVMARAIHAAGPRAGGPFIAVNCAAIPETLIESELFGHAPGAFTGAKREGAVGRIREANGGTLFLDEIGDMPVQMQTRLLRVLEDRQVTPIGGKPVPVDFLLISATHCDFKARIAQQKFRADLYYRLNGLAIFLPPARERTDLPALIERILEQEVKSRHVRLSDQLAQAFKRYSWPGNLRQLSGMLRTACLMLEEDETLLRMHHLTEEALTELSAKPAARTMELCGTTLRAHSDAMITAAIAEAGGNIAAAARSLGISRNTMYRRLGQKANAAEKFQHPV